MKKKDIKTIVFTGNDGGIVKDLADFSIIATGLTAAVIQELHIVFAHSLS